MEMLKQSPLSPYTTAQQYIILFVSLNGHLVDVEVKNASSFMKSFLEYMTSKNPLIMDDLDKTGESNTAIDQAIIEALESYKQSIKQER
jgi:F-type H+-transporting ATPase subunit alpha